MTTLTVNLLDTTSVEMALRVLGGLTQSPRPSAVESTGVMSTTAAQPVVQTQPSPAPAASDSAGTDGTDGDDSLDPTKEDIHGLVWRDDIHSTPPSMNADGSWRAKRGKKDEYEAAIKQRAQEHANEAGQAMVTSAPAQAPIEQPAPVAQSTVVSMPGASMPAAPAPTTPEPPIEYDQMARRFMGMMESGAIQDYNAVYSALSIDYNQLETNQTMIAALWHYMDALEDGQTHADAIRHALGS